MPGAAEKLRNAVIPDVAIHLNVSKENQRAIDLPNVVNNDNYIFFDISYSHAHGNGNITSYRNNLRTIGQNTSNILRNKETAKYKKYEASLGAANVTRFAPIIFDISGAIGPGTMALIKNKFISIPSLHGKINNEVYDKALKTFLNRVSFILAKYNFLIYNKYKLIHGSKYMNILPAITTSVIL